MIYYCSTFLFGLFFMKYFLRILPYLMMFPLSFSITASQQYPELKSELRQRRNKKSICSIQSKNTETINTKKNLTMHPCVIAEDVAMVNGKNNILALEAQASCTVSELKKMVEERTLISSDELTIFVGLYKNIYVSDDTTIGQVHNNYATTIFRAYKDSRLKKKK
jgi:hypothetical protein